MYVLAAVECDMQSSFDKFVLLHTHKILAKFQQCVFVFVR